MFVSYLLEASYVLVQVFSDVLVAFLYFDICHYLLVANIKNFLYFDICHYLLVANIKIRKSHLNIREDSDYLCANVGNVLSTCCLVPEVGTSN